MTKIEPDTLSLIQNTLTKRDLLDVISELSIPEPDITMRYSQLVDLIVQDCDKNSVPLWEDCSKLLRRFLMTAKITDENGELLTTDSVEIPAEESKESVEYPECFGLADQRDPACMRCKVFSECMEKHKNSLPPCYGKSYSDVAPECAICIERVSCKEKTHE